MKKAILIPHELRHQDNIIKYAVVSLLCRPDSLSYLSVLIKLFTATIVLPVYKSFDVFMCTLDSVVVIGCFLYLHVYIYAIIIIKLL